MSKIFSVVELETNTGIHDSGLMGGIPDCEDVESSKAKWFAGAALNTAEQAMQSVLSTALSILLDYIANLFSQI